MNEITPNPGGKEGEPLSEVVWFIKRFQELNPDIRKATLSYASIRLMAERARKPWISSFRLAGQRCNNPKHPAYSHYGGRGIKRIMTEDEFKFIYHRDNAHLMQRPTVDRIDNDGHYELSNCRYLESSENARKGNRPLDVELVSTRDAAK